MGFELTTLVVIGTDCTGNCKPNYHTIGTTTAPGVVVHVTQRKDGYQIRLVGLDDLF